MKKFCLKLSGYIIYLYIIFVIGSFLQADSNKSKTLVAAKAPAGAVTTSQANNANVFNGANIIHQPVPQGMEVSLNNAIKINVIKRGWVSLISAFIARQLRRYINAER